MSPRGPVGPLEPVWDFEDRTYRDALTGEELPLGEWPAGS